MITVSHFYSSVELVSAQFLRAVHLCGIALSKKNGVVHMMDMWLVLVIQILQGIGKSVSIRKVERVEVHNRS